MQTKVADTIRDMTAHGLGSTPHCQSRSDLYLGAGTGKTGGQSCGAVVVGSAIVNEIANCGKSSDLVPRVAHSSRKWFKPLRAYEDQS
jgi:hypothetical protein